MKETTGIRRCPGCGNTLLPGFPFCYHCCSFLTEDGSSLLPYEKVRDRDLQILLDLSKEGVGDLERKFRYRLAAGIHAVSLAVIAVSILSLIFGDPGWSTPAFFLGCLGVAVSFMLKPKDPPVVMRLEKLQQTGARYLAPNVLSQWVPDLSWDPEDSIPARVISRGQCFQNTYETYEGSQRLWGTYRGIPIEMGYVRLTSRNRKNYAEREIFEGYCLTARTGLSYPMELQMTQGGFHVLTHGRDPENENEWDNIFKGKSPNPEAAEKFLGPKRKKELAELANGSVGELDFRVFMDGNLFVAAGDLKNFYEIPETAEQWRDSYQKVFSQIFSVLDCLLKYGGFQESAG